MSRETEVGRWRDGDSSRSPGRAGPSSASKWLGAVGVSVLLAVTIGVVGWLAFHVWFASGPHPYFVAFWVSPYDRPEIPATAWLDADRRSLIDDQVFSKVDSQSNSADRQTLEVMRKRLDDLAGRRDEAVVVYLSAFAIVDTNKSIQIMAADSVPYEAKTQLPLSWVLDRLKSCPARNKLLVLDIMRGMIDPRDVGGTADGVGDLIAQKLQASADAGRLNDPDLMVITACTPGELALGSVALQHSVFGYYFHRGLTTQEADAGGDGTVSVRELADYLNKNVDAWAMHYRGQHQKPLLLGREHGDFQLASTRASRPPGTVNQTATEDRTKENAAATKEKAGESKVSDKTKKRKLPLPARAIVSWQPGLRASFLTGSRRHGPLSSDGRRRVVSRPLPAFIGGWHGSQFVPNSDGAAANRTNRSAATCSRPSWN